MDTAGMSRSEIRQLEKLQAMEAEKRKAEAPAPSSVAKKTTPARPAAAPATTPRATTGGKSMGLKGRAAAGGKSMGGKRPPQQPQSKKRKAGKKKKGDSSDSSSEESDSDSSSSSSDDDQEEVAAKMPVKKRGKLTPATPKPDSGDESSDFEPEFDNNFFKSDDDRKWLMSLSEMDREQIITERREKQELQREAWQLEHSKRKAAARAGASAVKAKEAKEPATPGPSASVARGRASREGNKAVDKNADKRAALEDMEARKVEQQQKRLGARADVMEEDDDDAPRKRQEERQAMKPRHRQIPQEEKYPLMEPKELEAVRVSRDRLIEYAQSPFFGEFVQGMFVRVTLGKNAEGKQRYLVCVVIGVKDKQTEYNVYCPVTRKQVTLRKHLTVKHAGEKKAYPITVVSNKPFEESEVRKWCRDMHNDKEDLPEKAELEELRGKVAKNWKEAFVYDEDTVESILQEKERAHRNEASGNVHIKKMKLEDELEIAWEHYKELQKEGKDQEMQNDAYGQWEQLKQQIEIYDEAVQRKKHTAESEAARHKVINSRNMSANRTVTKSIDSARNITCTRPYRQTVYFAFGKSEVANKIAEDDRFTGNELKQQKPVNKVLAPEELVKLDDEEEEEGGGEGGNAAAAQSMEVGDTLTSEEAASALQRAHISLNVQVDVGGQGATKKVAGEEGGGVLPWARAPNPLKPAPAAAPAASAGAKNKLSLDDYKRRRGLI